MIEFQNFGTEDNDRYLSYLRRCAQIPSNLSPVITLGYRKNLKILRGYGENLCWHRFFIDDEEFWPAPVGDWDNVDWQDVFKKHVPPETVFFAVPEYLVEIWRRELGEKISVEDQRDNWDYLLDLNPLASLEGKQFKKFRNAKNAFEKNYKYEIEEITPKIFDELRAFQAVAEKNLQSRVENHRVEAQEDDENFLLALEHWDELKNLYGFVVRVDGKIVAYFLDEQIDKTYSIGLFAKANYDFKGANQFIYWYGAKVSLERGILTTNIMDDAGEENLRFFKEHLTSDMLKKYFVTIKS